MMRDYLIDRGSISTEVHQTSSGSGGGCITGCFPERYNGPTETTAIRTQIWRPRMSMNLVRIDVKGLWSGGIPDVTRFYVYSHTTDGPIASVYIGEYGDHAFWTGSVPVDAGEQLMLGMDGCPYYGVLSISNISVSAWFDGNAGGGLTFMMQALE